jgi:DNA-binding XRE family transcriptional regulator
MTGNQLKAVRGRLGLTQAGLATLLGISPRTVHTLEKGETSPIETKYAQLVRRTLRLVPEGLSLRRKSLVFSDEVCWPADVYQTLVKAVGRRVRHIDCEAVISPSDAAAKAFGDVKYRVTYKGIEFAEGLSLVVDHLGNPSGPGGQPCPIILTEIPRGVPFRVLKPESDAAKYATIYEIGPEEGGRRIADISVAMECKCGAVSSGFDSIGFPVYSDMIIDLLEVSIVFSGLQPVDPRPTATLLRRTSPRFGVKTMGHKLDCQPEITGDGYRFGLLRPRGGVYYGLGFDRLLGLTKTIVLR